jgi:predicted Zn-dependent protease
MAPSDQKALMIFTLSKEKVLKQAADSTIKKLELTLVESKGATVNGLPAIVSISKQTVQDQSTGAESANMILSYFIEYGGLIYVFHGVAAEADFTTYRNQFESSMNTFTVLTDASKINVKPRRILIKKVNQTGTVTNVLASYGVKQEQMAEIALLNELELTAQIEAGKLIKIIGE